jgi:hypothetical protein
MSLWTELNWLKIGSRLFLNTVCTLGLHKTSEEASLEINHTVEDVFVTCHHTNAMGPVTMIRPGIKIAERHVTTFRLRNKTR